MKINGNTSLKTFTKHKSHCAFQNISPRKVADEYGDPIFLFSCEVPIQLAGVEVII
jgi:hypothetical protein